MAQSIEGFVGTSMDEARMSPIHYRVFALIAAGYFFDVADYVILGSLIPDMTRSGFATAPQLAIVGTSTLLGLFLGTVAQGEFTDRFGRKTVYQFNLLLYGIATIAAAFSPNWIWLASLRFIAGIGLGAEQPLCFAYAGEYAPKNIRGRFRNHRAGWQRTAKATAPSTCWSVWASSGRRRARYWSPMPPATATATHLSWCSGTIAAE